MTQVELTETDWKSLAHRWDIQQEQGIPSREQRFRVMLDLVEEVAGPNPGKILDLASGPGAISVRALRRFPDSRCVAVDVDPLLLAIGRGAHGDAGGRLTWVQCDLAGPEWPGAVADLGPFDAVLTATALHWLSAPGLARVYQGLASLIRPGGVFLNAEHLAVARAGSLLTTSAQNLRKRINVELSSGLETYREWWQSVRAEPALADLVAQHHSVFPDDHGHGDPVSSRWHEETLAMAGFSETGIVWRDLDNTVIAAIR